MINFLSHQPSNYEFWYYGKKSSISVALSLPVPGEHSVVWKDERLESTISRLMITRRVDLLNWVIQNILPIMTSDGVIPHPAREDNFHNINFADDFYRFPK